MITERRSMLEPLFQSNDGLHLSTYLVNRGLDDDLRSQLRKTINTAEDLLEPVLEDDEINRFLKPLYSLEQNNRFLHNLRGNLGIFRNQDSFRILRIPIELEYLCVLATTYHVKPLLRWLQMDREFFLLGLEGDLFHLYHGSQHQLRQILVLPMAWLKDGLARIPRQSQTKLFVVGERTLTHQVFQHLRSGSAMRLAYPSYFHPGRAEEIAADIRRCLKRETRRDLEKAFIEYHCAEELQLACKELPRIAQAAGQGRIRKLIIADGLNLFGKLDTRTGHIALHAGHQNHEDDDVLDDLAQTVLNQGGEVIMASRHQLPRKHPALAILHQTRRPMAETQLPQASATC